MANNPTDIAARAREVSEKKTELLREVVTSRLPTRDNPEEFAFEVGDQVRKPKGYSFDGEVRAAFHNTTGAARYVVELAPGNGGGMLHIFSGGQLELNVRTRGGS